MRLETGILHQLGDMECCRGGNWRLKEKLLVVFKVEGLKAVPSFRGQG